MSGRRVGAAIVALVACSVDAQTVTLRDVLARSGSYVAQFERQFAGIITEEHYVQEVKRFAPGPGQPVNPMRIELRSDLLLVRGDPAARWIQYRDVFDVDGTAVRDRTERLADIFQRSGPSRDELVRTILDDSARYNIGAILRNINVPLLALQFLEPANQSRFRFKQTSERVPAAVPESPAPDGAFRVSVEMWTIQFEERERPTIIRTPERRDVPSRGRFWIDPATGHVLMTELIVENRSVKATIDVSYQSGPLVGMLVPVEMRERYEGRRDRSLIEGYATYGRFRQVATRR